MLPFEKKICTREALASRMAQLPQPVVLTNGVFDILHRGHVTYLAQARALGASLVVAVNTDDSVRRLGKGSDRPLNECADRMAVLAALEAVSLVVPFSEDTAIAVVLHGRPQIYAKGATMSCARLRKVVPYLGTVVRQSQSRSSMRARLPVCWQRCAPQNDGKARMTDALPNQRGLLLAPSACMCCV